MMIAMMMAVLLGGASPAQEQATAQPPCPANPVALPAEMAGWRRMVPLKAGTSAAKATDLAIGEGARLALLPAAGLAYPVPPAKPGDAASKGGIVSVRVPVDGRYRIALGAGAWIDVVKDGKALPSAAHSHGPACSGIRKMVDFDLTPGRYLIQLAASPAADLPIMVARLP